MSFVTAILQALFEALANALMAYKRDQDLKELGYTEAQRDAANASLTQINAVQAKINTVPDADRTTTLDRLRNGTF